ncbi:MAG: hypothetical protein PHX08_02045 [Lachnospiraceae bacterium]|nr:hypothetical protein [Lachnospiraceae bacterium]
MNPIDAINAINQLPEQTTELIECLRTNKLEATNLLLSELDTIAKSAMTEDKLPAKNVSLILNLIAEFQIKEAFEILDFVLSNSIVSFFPSEAFLHAVCNSVTETDLPTLKEYVSCIRYPENTRIVAYLAIKTILLKKTSNTSLFSREDFDVFLSETLATYPALDKFLNHTLLYYLFEECRISHSYKICLEMKALLIRLIIEDEKGYNSSCFKDYFNWLYQLEPTLSHTVGEIIKFVHQYNKQMDNDVFTFSDLQSVGKHIFYKAISIIESANTDIVKLAIKQMHRYPHNDRREPTTEENYYSEICVNAGILQLPKTILQHAQNQYESVFRIDITKVTSAITIQKNNLEATKLDLEQRRERVIAENNQQGRKIGFNIKPHVDELDEIGISLKRCEAEIELLMFYEEQIKTVQTSFCENYTESVAIDSALKKLSRRFVTYSEDDTRGMKIDDYFDEYKRVIEQIDSLVGSASGMCSIDLIFDKIIFLPFLKRIREDSLSTHVKLEKYKGQLSEHPLHPENLVAARADTNGYISLLKQYSEKAVNNIRDVFSRSIALAPRKELVEKCIVLFIDSEYGMFVNTLPIQIEGMLDDLLRSMVFDLFTDINLHPNAVLRDKIDILNRKNANMFFEVEAYFKYYFNGIIRNTIAHGNFTQLSDSDGSYQKLALELLFCLNYFADTIIRINELDAMNEYVNSTVLQFNSCQQISDVNIFYDCLFSDLNGTRSRIWKSNYKSGLFKAYPPKQILWWIFNPFYESFCKYSNELNTLRDLLKSPDFWNYILNKLNSSFVSPRFDKDKFESVVKIMFSLTHGNSETTEILKNINKSLKSIE